MFTFLRDLRDVVTGVAPMTLFMAFFAYVWVALDARRRSRRAATGPSTAPGRRARDDRARARLQRARGALPPRARERASRTSRPRSSRSSTAATRDLAAVAAEYCDRVLRIPKSGKRAAIAAGLRASDPATDVVIVLDSDTVWERGRAARDAAPVRGPARRRRDAAPGDLRRRRQPGAPARGLDRGHPLPPHGAGAVGVRPGRLPRRPHDRLPPRRRSSRRSSGSSRQTVLGVPQHVGDDRVLTNELLRNGWRTVYQSTALVETDAPSDWRTFWRQQLRWGRSSQRETLLSLRWLWRRPVAFACFATDIVTPFALYAVVALAVAHAPARAAAARPGCRSRSSCRSPTPGCSPASACASSRTSGGPARPQAAAAVRAAAHVRDGPDPDRRVRDDVPPGLDEPAQRGPRVAGRGRAAAGERSCLTSGPRSSSRGCWPTRSSGPATGASTAARWRRWSCASRGRRSSARCRRRQWRAPSCWSSPSTACRTSATSSRASRRAAGRDGAPERGRRAAREPQPHLRRRRHRRPARGPHRPTRRRRARPPLARAPPDDLLDALGPLAADRGRVGLEPLLRPRGRHRRRRRPAGRASGPTPSPSRSRSSSRSSTRASARPRSAPRGRLGHRLLHRRRPPGPPPRRLRRPAKPGGAAAPDPAAPGRTTAMTRTTATHGIDDEADGDEDDGDEDDGDEDDGDERRRTTNEAAADQDDDDDEDDDGRRGRRTKTTTKTRTRRTKTKTDDEDDGRGGRRGRRRRRRRRRTTSDDDEETTARRRRPTTTTTDDATTRIRQPTTTTPIDDDDADVRRRGRRRKRRRRGGAVADHAGRGASGGPGSRRLDVRAGPAARSSGRAAGDGGAGRVGPVQPRLRRRRLGRVLPDAGGHLEQRPATPATPTGPSCSSSGSSTRPRPSRAAAPARGLPIDDPARFGEWIADIERPAEQYRGRYQLQLDEARELLRYADALPEAAPRPPARTRRRAHRGRASARAARRSTARARPVGVRPGRIELPRDPRGQFGGGHAGVARRLLAGDLVFFRSAPARSTRSASPLGGKRFISAARGVVEVSSLGKHAAEFAGVRRFDGRSAAGADSRPAADVERPGSATDRSSAVGPDSLGLVGLVVARVVRLRVADAARRLLRRGAWPARRSWMRRGRSGWRGVPAAADGRRAARPRRRSRGPRRAAPAPPPRRGRRRRVRGPRAARGHRRAGGGSTVAARPDASTGAVAGGRAVVGVRRRLQEPGRPPPARRRAARSRSPRARPTPAPRDRRALGRVLVQQPLDPAARPRVDVAGPALRAAAIGVVDLPHEHRDRRLGVVERQPPGRAARSAITPTE